MKICYWQLDNSYIVLHSVHKHLKWIFVLNITPEFFQSQSHYILPDLCLRSLLPCERDRTGVHRRSDIISPPRWTDCFLCDFITSRKFGGFSACLPPPRTCLLLIPTLPFFFIKKFTFFIFFSLPYTRFDPYHCRIQYLHCNLWKLHFQLKVCLFPLVALSPGLLLLPLLLIHFASIKARRIFQ